MSHRIPTLALVLLLFVLGPAPVLAQETPVDDARIDRLLEITRARQILDGVLPQVEASQRQLMAQMTAGQELDAAQRQRLNEVVSRSNATIARTLAWENIEPIYRDIYRKTFSAEDIDAMIAFYETPTGQRMIEKMPALMQNTMESMQQLVVPMMQQLEQDLRRETAEATGG